MAKEIKRPYAAVSRVAESYIEIALRIAPLFAPNGVSLTTCRNGSANNTASPRTPPQVQVQTQMQMMAQD